MLQSKIFSYILFIIFINIFKCSITKAVPQQVFVLEGQKDNNSAEKDLPFFDVRFDEIPEKCYKKSLPKDCATATACTDRSGIYTIQLREYSSVPFPVNCDDETDNGDWLVIQRRQDGSEDFYRNWVDYENGFGDIAGEFFIGLQKLHALTTYNGPQELLIVMQAADGTKAYAKYESFAIANKTESYKLKRLGRYSGTAGNSFSQHVGFKFSTKDRRNDMNLKDNCAVSSTGAWWYGNTFCHQCNLNGKYGDDSFGMGINWKEFLGSKKSLVYVKMMIRRSRII